MTITTSLSPRATAAPESGIVEVVNYARGREGLIPLWVGEGDLPTPDFVSRAAADALMGGETFYTWQRGIPPLREALARYYQRRFQKTLSPENFYVTGSGMQAIKLAIESVASPGDEMVLLTPAWPNFAAAADLSGVRPVAVPLRFEAGKWQLDLTRLEAAIARGRVRFSSIRRLTRPAGPLRLMISSPSWRWRASTAFGSSPTKSTPSIITSAAGRRRSST